VRFYTGDFVKAAVDFTKVADAQPNAYASIWLYLSRVRDATARQAAAADLAKTSAGLQGPDWPNPVVELYLGKQPAEAVRTAAGDARQRCEGEFYIGEWHFAQEDRAKAAAAFKAAVDACPHDFIEYRAAAEELKRLKR
jgi:lipoprotein NlpI